MNLESLQGGLDQLRGSNLSGASMWLSAGLEDEDLSPPARTLLLHLSGLVRFARRDPELASSRLAAAAELEKAQGWVTGAQHTSHQWALLAHAEGALSHSRHYYRESLENLRRTRNLLGAGLCLRSLGELAAVTGRPEQALVLWRTSAASLGRCQAPELEQVQAWVELLRAVGIDAARPA